MADVRKIVVEVFDQPEDEVVRYLYLRSMQLLFNMKFSTLEKPSEST